MANPKEYRELGMGRRVARRDFLNGVAIAVTGACTAGRFGRATVDAWQAGSRVGSGNAYPPALAGLRGNYPAAVEAFEPLAAGTFRSRPVDVDTHEGYDLVVVGAGISGLSAAHFWRRALGDDRRVLLLDNHDDFGGHAKRNEFTYGGRTFLAYGGTMSIATPYPYSYTAKRLIEELGIDVRRNADVQNREAFQKLRLGAGMFFDREHFGEDRLVAGIGRLPWPEFAAQAPLSARARTDLVRLYGTNPDYMAGMDVPDKIAKLASISYQDYLLHIARITPNLVPFFMGQGGRNNKRVDSTPALEAARHGSPGFDGLGLDLKEEFREASYTFHFPDGNASIARLLVSRLVPGAVHGDSTADGIVNASIAYNRLDAETSPVRIRLRSTAVAVDHEGDPARAERVRVAYVRDGKVHTVRGRHVVLACYNTLIPSLVPDLPAKQKEALAYAAKVPMMYTNVLVRKWTAWAALGVSAIQAPCLYHTTASLDPGTTVGGYRGVTTPDEPIVVHLVRNPNTPGLPRREQNRLGQRELLSTTFEQFELEIRRQLGRMLAGGGFDPAADIAAITVNRWPYGYAYTYDTLADADMPPEQRPHVIGRQRFGRVAIANSDAGAAAFTNQAIDEAHRAVEELLIADGLT